MNVSDLRECFYVPGKPGIIDAVHPNTGRGVYSGETLADIQARHPGACVGDFDAVCDQQDDYWRQPPTRITRERFVEMLEVLPPVGWERGPETEVFKLMERTSGPITAIFCRIGDTYWEMQDRIDTPAGKIIAACEAALKAS